MFFNQGILGSLSKVDAERLYIFAQLNHLLYVASWLPERSSALPNVSCTSNAPQNGMGNDDAHTLLESSGGVSKRKAAQTAGPRGAAHDLGVLDTWTELGRYIKKHWCYS